MRRLLLSWCICVLLFLPARAQDAPPLQAPLIALNTVDREHIVLYDVRNDTYRDLRLGNGAHHVWDFAPDGCRVLVTVQDGTRPARLLSATLAGDDLRQMVTFTELPPDRWGVWAPDWSPDGTRIAFTMSRERFRDGAWETDHHTAFVTPPDTRPQFYSVTGREFSPVWSPDGAWLAYVSYNERPVGANVFATAVPTVEPAPGQTPQAPTLVNEADLWMVSADASIKYQLTNFETGSVSQPRWSPDSELLSFVYSPSPNNDTVWMIANERGAIPTQLNYQWMLALDNVWRPDATAVIGALRDFQEIDPNRLWQLPLVAGPDDTRAELYLPDVDLNFADYPRFSPDGRYLAVRSAYEMRLYDFQRETLRVLDERVFGNSAPVWSPADATDEADCPPAT